jgi:hypothetical protein
VEGLDPWKMKEDDTNCLRARDVEAAANSLNL